MVAAEHLFAAVAVRGGMAEVEEFEKVAGQAERSSERGSAVTGPRQILAGIASLVQGWDMVMGLYLEQIQGLMVLARVDQFVEDSCSTRHWGRERELRQEAGDSTPVEQVLEVVGADKDLGEPTVSCSANSPSFEAVVAGDIGPEHNQEQRDMMDKEVEVWLVVVGRMGLEEALGSSFAGQCRSSLLVHYWAFGKRWRDMVRRVDEASCILPGSAGYRLLRVGPPACDRNT